MEFKSVWFGKDNFQEFEYYDYRYCAYKGLLVEGLVEPVKIIQNLEFGKGGTLWDASYVLAKYLESMDLVGKKVVELGAGTGLPSILCAIKGADVVATDLADSIPLTNMNIQENIDKVRGSIRTAELDWCNENCLEELGEINWDYVIFSDVFYLPSLVADFARTLSFLAKRHTQIVFTYKFRVAHTVNPFLKSFESYTQINLDSVCNSIHYNKNIHMISMTKSS
ncbi:hypothetical protein SteCoe_22058 [Stentor coeruleus]|uniref:Uncharacterized protein n=1 Tax=Stentor coeruleus TaxID=5963 RepID=A0A1R2BN11_9CILI|nr:hypothetical protein SteCoe_22058 [Stentor coeruleus]